MQAAISLPNILFLGPLAFPPLSFMSTPCPQRLRALRAHRHWFSMACKILLRNREQAFSDDAYCLDFGVSYAQEAWNEVLLKLLQGDVEELLIAAAGEEQEFQGPPKRRVTITEDVPKCPTGSSSSTGQPKRRVAFAQDARQ